MSYYADLIDKLAVDVLKAAEEIGDDRLAETIAQAIGASSPTTEELFRTAVRIRMAEARARRMLDEKIAGHKRSGALAAATQAAETRGLILPPPRAKASKKRQPAHRCGAFFATRRDGRAFPRPGFVTAPRRALSCVHAADRRRSSAPVPSARARLG
jgi:hypothetical protein